MNNDLTTRGAAEVLGCSAYHVRDLLQTGRLRGYKLEGGDLKRRPWRVRRKDLDDYINSRRVYNDSMEWHEAMSNGGYCDARR